MCNQSLWNNNSIPESIYQFFSYHVGTCPWMGSRNLMYHVVFIILAPSFSISERNNSAGIFFEIFFIISNSFSFTIVKTVCPNNAALQLIPFCIKESIRLLQFLFTNRRDCENLYDIFKNSKVPLVSRSFIIILMHSALEIFLIFLFTYSVNIA